MPIFKLQVQDDGNDERTWHDVTDPDGKVLLFTEEAKARARLEELFPVLVGLEKYAAGHKRTRVLHVYGHDGDEEEDR
jgi:hypothetical protein